MYKPVSDLGVGAGDRGPPTDQARARCAAPFRLRHPCVAAVWPPRALRVGAPVRGRSGVRRRGVGDELGAAHVLVWVCNTPQVLHDRFDDQDVLKEAGTGPEHAR